VVGGDDVTAIPPAGTRVMLSDDHPHGGVRGPYDALEDKIERVKARLRVLYDRRSRRDAPLNPEHGEA
jgi:hypothetical protein